MAEKEKRVQLYENEDIVLEQRGNKYYLSLFDKEGKFQREVTITAKDEYSWSFKMVDNCHKLMNSMIDVGTDVGFYSNDHLWAVICIKGRPEYVKFIPLSHKDAQEVLYFLKRFRYSDRVVDLPFAFKDMVEHCIIENPFGK